MSSITTTLKSEADGQVHLTLPEEWKGHRIRIIAHLMSSDEDDIAEHTVVRLKHDLDGDGLKQGETGTVVDVYEGGVGYEVEFLAASPRPKLVTVEPSDIEPA